MKRLSISLLASAVGLLLFAGGQARADIGWHIDWSPTNSPVALTGDVQMNFSNLNNTGFTNKSQVTASNLSLGFLAPLTGTEQVGGGFPQTYQLQAVLTDDASGQKMNLSFTGNISGTIAPSNINLSNTFVTGPITFTLGDKVHGYDTYTVSMTQFIGPNPFDTSKQGGTQGAIQALVDVTHKDGPPPNNTPEPSTMLLSCLGVSFAGFAAWRRRRAAQTVDA